MKSTSEIAGKKTSSINYRDSFAQFMTESERERLQSFPNEISFNETIDLYISTLANTYARAKRARDEFQRRIAQSVNQKLKLLNKIGQVILDEEIKDEQLRSKI